MKVSSQVSLTHEQFEELIISFLSEKGVKAEKIDKISYTAPKTDFVRNEEMVTKGKLDVQFTVET